MINIVNDDIIWMPEHVEFDVNGIFIQVSLKLFREPSYILNKHLKFISAFRKKPENFENILLHHNNNKNVRHNVKKWYTVIFKIYREQITTNAGCVERRAQTLIQWN